MFRKDDVIRVRNDFDWTSDNLYTSFMEGFNGKYGRVRNFYDTINTVEVDLEDTDNSSNWSFRAEDLEKVEYQKGDELIILPGFIERDEHSLYYDAMRYLEGEEVKFHEFGSFDGHTTVYVDVVNQDGYVVDQWSFYLYDLEPCMFNEVFNEEQTLDSILGALL